MKLCKCLFLHGMWMCTWFGYNCKIIFCHCFHFMNFLTSMYRLWVFCERNSSYNFIPIFLKLSTCFSLVWRCGLYIILVTLPLCELRHFRTSDSMKVYTDFFKLCTCFSMVWRCTCGLDIILELMFVIFPLCEFCHFLTSDSMKMYRHWLPCECNSLYNFIPIFIQLCTPLFHSLKMCKWFGFNPAVIFVTFPLC